MGFIGKITQMSVSKSVHFLAVLYSVIQKALNLKHIFTITQRKLSFWTKKTANLLKRPNSIDLCSCLDMGRGLSLSGLWVLRSTSLSDWLQFRAFVLCETTYFGTGRITFNDEKKCLTTIYCLCLRIPVTQIHSLYFHLPIKGSKINCFRKKQH